jgi:hypothetical protein
MLKSSLPFFYLSLQALLSHLGDDGVAQTFYEVVKIVLPDPVLLADLKRDNVSARNVTPNRGRVHL